MCRCPPKVRGLSISARFPAFKNRLMPSLVHDEIRVLFEKVQDGANVIKRVVQVK